MRRVFIVILSGVVGCLALSTVARAKGPDPADYPLRVHVLKNSPLSNRGRGGRTISQSPGYLDGAGGADLFEGGQPVGFQFRYSCMEALKPSEAYAIYPARWKKRDKTLEILIPQAGKPWNLESCDLQVQMRPGLAYFWNPDDDRVIEEPAAKFREWMLKHHYDPEKDIDMPMEDAPEPPPTQAPGTSSSGQVGIMPPEPK